MKDQEITQNNKLIAEFMHPEMLDVIKEHKKGNVKGIDIDGDMIIKMSLFMGNYELLKFHSSWDWLMPVVEKIENLKLGNLTFNNDPYLNCCVEIEIIISHCNIHLYADMKAYKDLINVKNETTKLNGTYKAVIEFIKWYNENK